MNKSCKPKAIIDLQVASEHIPAPNEEHYQEWAEAVLTHLKKNAGEITIRIVDAHESQELNNTYRQKNKPTNVLSFPSELPSFIEQPLLGDLVICASVVSSEALEQKKMWRDHWAHMVVHGTLHLLGYDHVDDDEAEHMEALEIAILSNLGLNNPYSTE